jgi:hypothetical protein
VSETRCEPHPAGPRAVAQDRATIHGRKAGADAPARPRDPQIHNLVNINDIKHITCEAGLLFGAYCEQFCELPQTGARSRSRQSDPGLCSSRPRAYVRYVMDITLDDCRDLVDPVTCELKTSRGKVSTASREGTKLQNTS